MTIKRTTTVPFTTPEYSQLFLKVFKYPVYVQIFPVVS